jgi:protoheme IX farnesyltransferase
MKTAVIEAAATVPIERGWTMADLAELVKARLTFLVLITTAVGFYAGWHGPMDFIALAHAVIGTAFAAAGAAALNQWWEHKYDALMVRTRMRPIPAGRMSPREGLVVGTILGIGGVSYLAITTNLISAALAAATIAIYLFAYTPLKRISVSNTLIGAIPGALPPLIGWSAARNDLALPAWTLFAILFFWQLPHFFAIGWIYREDYERAGFVMLSGRDLEGARTGRQSVIFTVLLLLASVTPVWLGIASYLFLPVAISLGGLFLGLAVRFQLSRNLATARQLFLASIIYLPLLLGALVLTRR